MTYLMYFRFTN